MDLGDRMKWYEGLGPASTFLLPLQPVVIRLDGARFHTFTRKLERPFDSRLSELMMLTTEFLVGLTNARIGYTQSDEISLVLYTEDFASKVYFEGKVGKILSVLASETSVFFNKKLTEFLPEKAHLSPVFDCRVWNVPNQIEAVNALLWRELDATKNSISMAARAYFSHKQLHGKNGSEMQEMLFQNHKINWNDYPTFFKRGTYVQRKKVQRQLTPEELAKMPVHIHPISDVVERSVIKRLNLPPMNKIANREGVVFKAEEPLLAEPTTNTVAFA